MKQEIPGSTGIRAKKHLNLMERNKSSLNRNPHQKIARFMKNRHCYIKGFNMFVN